MGHSTSSLGRRARHSDPLGVIGRKREVQALFDDLAKALTTADRDRIAAHWEVPAFVLGDGTAHAVSSLDEVRALFGTVRTQYNERGVIDTRANLVRVDWPTREMAIVEIHWPYLDVDGKEVGGERATYTLRRDAHGTLKIRAVVLHGEEQGHAATA